MAKKVNFYTDKQISELKTLTTDKATVEAWAKKNGRKPSQVLGVINYYRYRYGKGKSTKKNSVVKNNNATTNVIKSRSRGEFLIPVSSVEVRTTDAGINLVFKY